MNTAQGTITFIQIMEPPYLWIYLTC